MDNETTTITTASKIWFRTSLVFSIGFFIIVSFNDGPFGINIFVIPLSFLASMLGSLPVLVAFLVVLPIIQNFNKTWQQKFKYVVGFTLFITLCYGFIGAAIGFNILPLHFLTINNFFSDLLAITLILFSCSTIAISSCTFYIAHYLSNNTIHINSYQSFFQQLFFKQKSNTMNTENTNQPEQHFASQAQAHKSATEKKHSDGILIKGIITGILILVMLIPTFFISNLVSERKELQQAVVKEVSSKWANAQTLSAPFIVVPYAEQSIEINGKTEAYKKNLYILADKLEATGSIFPEERKRSIYKVLLYKSDIKFAGSFKPNWPKDINMANVDFANAKICFGLSDFKGIEEELFININNEKILLRPGLTIKEMGNAIVSAPIAITESSINAGINYDIRLKIKGSEQLHFIPLSSNSKFNLNSTWDSPSFDGNTLPNTNTVKDSGFAAQWNFNGANLPFGNIVKEGTFKINETAFGVSLVQPADQYSKTTRSLKYAILLIGLSFALFFIIELMQKKPLHPVQYVLVGLALVIFYTLLLSIGEYLVFDIAYLTAAAATIALITLYAKSHFDSWKSASIFATLLSCLYCFVFILIRLEDAALLVGSIGLFIILALVMYGSRKINWYNK